MKLRAIRIGPASIDVSVVIPVMNEEESIPVLAAEVEAAMGEVGVPWECIWVDDGSTDNTAQILTTLHGSNNRHQYVISKQNEGQSAALALGFEHSCGEAIITLDGDGQNDPASIPALYREFVDRNHDLVNGYRATRRDSFLRRISSRIANAFRNKVTGDQIRDTGCALRIFKRECVRHIPVWRGMHRFLPTLIRINGYDKVGEIPVNHRPRERGTSKYGLRNRLGVGIADTYAVCWLRARHATPEAGTTSAGPTVVESGE